MGGSYFGCFFFFQAEDGIRDIGVTGVQTCALPISNEIPMILERLKRGEVIDHYETVRVAKDGRRLDISLTISPIRDSAGNIAGASTIARNITERKRAEKALKESEWLYRTVIEQATENIFLVDAETRRIVESNPAFQQALGYTEEELRSMTLYDIVAADRKSIDSNIRLILEQKHRSAGERKFRRKDVSLEDVEVSVSTILCNSRVDRKSTRLNSSH